MKKKIFLLLTIMAVSFSVVGCSNNGSEVKSETTENETDESVKEKTDSKKGSKYETNKDLQVVAGFTYDGYTYVVVENTGDKPILNYSVAYINYDENGFSTTSGDGYRNGRNDAANIMPGGKAIARWLGDSGKYVDAVVTSVDYSDDTTWEMNEIETWADSSKGSFSVDKYNDKIAELDKVAPLAESNEYLSLDGTSMEHRNQFSTSSDFSFTLTNKASQGITKASVFVLQFDASGFPVSVSPYDTYCLNGRSTGGTINLTPGSTDTLTDNLFFDANTTQYKVVISSITFQDETTWTNPYLYEWIIANNKSY